jgi:RNA polymerase sigma-70 factor (ECF subfamily)
MLGVKAGDDTCMEILFQQHRAPLVRYLRRMVQNNAIAEELAQEVFLRVYRSRKHYVPTAKFTSWLFHIATRLALNWLRDHRHDNHQESIDEPAYDGFRKQYPVLEPTADQWMIRQAALEQVKQAIAELPDRQRAAVLMHKYEEMDYVQIASALRISLQATRSLLFRAYSNLRRRLIDLEPISPQL